MLNMLFQSTISSYTANPCVFCPAKSHDSWRSLHVLSIYINLGFSLAQNALLYSQNCCLWPKLLSIEPLFWLQINITKEKEEPIKDREGGSDLEIALPKRPPGENKRK